MIESRSAAGPRSPPPTHSRGMERRMHRFASVVLAFSMLTCVLPARADGQTTTRARPQRQYDAGWLHRTLLGDLKPRTLGSRGRSASTRPEDLCLGPDSS